MTAKVKYQIATYEGVVMVNCEDDSDHDHIIAKAKRMLQARVGHLPFGYERWEVVELIS